MLKGTTAGVDDLTVLLHGFGGPVDELLLIQVLPVVPEPEKGSKMMSPFRDVVSIGITGK